MTHPTYTQQALCRYTLPRLKRIATELGVTPTGDKRGAETWVNAIIAHQSTKLQKVDNQALAQAELDYFIADQAQAIAPEPLRIVEISFSHHEYYAGDELVASISHDDNHLTQRWVVMVKSLRSNSKFKIQNSKLKTISGGLYPQLINSKLFPFFILNFEFCILNSKKVNDKELFRANTLMRCDRFICTHYKDGTLPVKAEVQGSRGAEGKNLQQLSPLPLRSRTPMPSSSTENQIMAHIFNECQNYNNSQLPIRNSQLHAMPKNRKLCTCNDSITNYVHNCELRTANCELLSNWWVIQGYSSQQQYSNSVFDAVRSLSMVDTSLAEPVHKYLQDRPLEQLSSNELQQLFNQEVRLQLQELVAV